MAATTTTSEAVGASEVRARAVSSVKAMGVRAIVKLMLSVCSTIFLSHLLFPKDTGLFAVAASTAGFSWFLCEAGLKTVLLWQEHIPTDDEKATVFWTGQFLSVLVVVCVGLFMPQILQANKIDSSATWLIMAMTMGIFLQSLRTVPSVILERDVRFEGLARNEIVEKVVQVVSVVTLAKLGFGPWALVASDLGSRALNLAMLWRIAPYLPRGTFRLRLLLFLFRKGLPIYLSGLLYSAVGTVQSTLFSRFVGVAVLGLYSWSINLLSVITIFTTMLNGVAFPTFSRLQNEPEELGKMALQGVRSLIVILGSVLPLVIFVAPLFVPFLFPRYKEATPFIQWGVVEIVLQSAIGLLAQWQSASGRALDRSMTVVAIGIVRMALLYFAATIFGIKFLPSLLYLASFAEVVVTCIFIYANITGGRTIFREVMLPIIGLGAATALAAFIGEILVHGWAGAAAGLIIYLLLLTVYDFLSGGLVQREIGRGLKMLRKRNAPIIV